MCSPAMLATIVLAVEELVHMRHTFTGKDVFDRIHNKHIRRAGPIFVGSESPKEISNDVRKLFNTQDPVFTDYGSTIVPDHGPVLYFALPHHAKLNASRIAAVIADTQTPVIAD